MFNLMFETHMGPVRSDENTVHLRPETAQGIFVNFANVVTATRRRPPFGIAQIGKAFRNEITTGNFIYRTREFEMMEIEFFVQPGEDEEWHERWIDESLRWYASLGVDESRLRVRPHDPDELSHYSKATSDIEYRFPWGWGEIQGTANRTDYDLRAHAAASGASLSYFDDALGDHVVPYVIEPSFGVDRAMMTFLVDAYAEEEAVSAKGKPEKRVVLRLHPALAPVKVAVLPLSRNERLTPTAREVYDIVRRSGAGRRTRPVRRRPEHRPPLPPPGRDRHAPLRDRRLRHPRRPRRHHPRPRHHAAAARPGGWPGGGAARPLRGVRETDRAHEDNDEQMHALSQRNVQGQAGCHQRPSRRRAADRRRSARARLRPVRRSDHQRGDRPGCRARGRG